MEQIIPMSWLNKILLIASFMCAVLCLIIELWIGLTSLPVYIPIVWSLAVIIGSTWLSCVLLKSTLKANSPIEVASISGFIHKRLGIELNSRDPVETVPDKVAKTCDDIESSPVAKVSKISSADLDKILHEIDQKLIDNWYSSVSDDKSFNDKCNEILKKILERICDRIYTVNSMKLTHKLADILLLHFKEYRRALRRVEKGKAKDIEDAYRYLHPGSRSSTALEHTLHRLVTIIAREFLQWELTSSLPCKLLLSILAKKLLIALSEISTPQWIFSKIIHLLESSKHPCDSETINGGVVSEGLSTGITSATAAVISRPLPKPIPDIPQIVEIKVPPERTSSSNTNRISLCLDGLSTIGHKGLWADMNDGPIDYDDDEDRVSPVYEEPTDFATTIARLRNLLQQKSTATSPLHIEEKSYPVCDGNQFLNLAIPWTEFQTSPDGSQQLLYCIQFDDVEQHGDDMFETTTATVRRQYADFVQLHRSLEENSAYSAVMLEIRLPEGGRTEMETYLKTLCTRLAPESPVQLRHFLRPSSGSGKKADAVAPRFDRLLAKTVTGMFNTLRTVVPGFEMDQEDEALPVPTLMPLSDIPWRFVEDIKSKSLADELKILIADRAEYCSVDTAYEAVESVEGSGDSELLAHWWKTVNTPFDEELEELDSKLLMTCAGIDLICEILAGIESNNTLRQEAVVRWTKLFLGSITEPLIRDCVTRAFQQLGIMSVSLEGVDHVDEDVDDLKKKLLEILTAGVSIDFKLIFGKDDMNKIAVFVLDSLQTKKVNLDIMLQIVDILGSELLVTCKSSHRNLLL